LCKEWTRGEAETSKGNDLEGCYPFGEEGKKALNVERIKGEVVSMENARRERPQGGYLEHWNATSKGTQFGERNEDCL